jgi:hypothetical protein
MKVIGRQKLVLKVTKSKNREAIAEQRIMNQINHPNILFSYGLIYPENYKKLDLKNLEKYLPKRNKQLMSSVDKLMKKNKYGERQFPKFEKNRSPMMKHYGDIKGALGKNRVKMSVSPNPLRPGVRKKFNFSKTFKDFELGKEIKLEDGDMTEPEKDAENIKDQRNLNLNKYVSHPKYVGQKEKVNNINSKSKPKYRVKLIRNRKLKNLEQKINLHQKQHVKIHF